MPAIGHWQESTHELIKSEGSVAMKTRRELDEAAKTFAKRHGAILHEPEGIYDGQALYYYTWPGMVKGGCYGPPAYILVNVETGEAQWEDNIDLDKYISNEVRSNLMPMPEE